MKTMNSADSVILITGAGGFLGGRLVSIFEKKISHCRLIAVRRGGIAANPFSNNVTIVDGDLRAAATWSRLPDSITHVFHAAARIPWQKDEKNRAAVAEDNIIPLAHLIEYSQRWPGLRQIVFSSSVSVYSPSKEYLSERSRTLPENIYGASKLAGESLLTCMSVRGVKTVCLRYSSLYGAGQYPGTVLPLMVGRALEGKDIVVYGDGGRTQDFLECDDAVYANLLAYERNAEGVFNIGSGTPTSMKELAIAISDVFSEGRSKVVCAPEKRENDPGCKMDISKAQEQLQYFPAYQLPAGLKKLKEDQSVKGGSNHA